VPKNRRRESAQQLTWRYSKTARELQNNGQARYLVASLNLSYVRSGQFGRIGKVFLRPCAADSKLANVLAKDFTRFATCHA